MGNRFATDKRGVRYVAAGRPAPNSFIDPATCGTCGRTWDDGVSTSVTPAPSGRCPFEYQHKSTQYVGASEILRSTSGNLDPERWEWVVSISKTGAQGGAWLYEYHGAWQGGEDDVQAFSSLFAAKAWGKGAGVVRYTSTSPTHWRGWAPCS